MNEYYGEIPSSIKSLKSKRLRNKKVHFANTLQISDGSTDTLQNYKIVVDHMKQVLFLSSFYVDSSMKELIFVPLVN